MKKWLQLQKELYRDTYSEAQKIMGPLSADLKRYAQGFERDQKNLTSSSEAAFIRSTNESQVLLIGDFHTLRQSQRTLLRLLRDNRLKAPKHIAFELLPVHQPQKLNAKMLDRFGSSIETYQEILDLCRERKISIHGLWDGEHSLKKRDHKVAQRISKLQGRVWVLMGEYHCARPHLPQILLAQLPLKITILQQNHDRQALQRLSQFTDQKSLWLESPSKQKESSRLFCLLHTPVWMKWHSFIERHAGNWGSDFEGAIHDPEEQVRWCLKTLLEFLADSRYPFGTATKDLLDFEIFQADRSEFYRLLSRLTSAEQKSVLRQLRAGSAAVAVQSRCLFLTENTLNACAHAAASLIFRKLTSLQNEDQDFFVGCLIELMSFFLSKVMNHSRRSLTWLDWKERSLRNPGSSEALSVLRSARFPFVYAQKKAFFKSLGSSRLETRSALARVLADALFEAFLAQEFSKTRLSRLLTSSIRDDKQAFEILVELKSVGEAFSHR